MEKQICPTVVHTWIKKTKMFLSIKRNIKAFLVLFFYIVFLIASIIGVVPFASINHNQGSVSDELILQETSKDSLTSYTYVNTSNVIT